MTSNVDKLVERLYGEGGLGAKNIKFTRGSNPNVTAEEIAGEINRSLDALQAGNFEEVPPNEID